MVTFAEPASSSPALDVDLLRRWIGRREIRDETLSTARTDALAAMLDHDAPPAVGSALPPLWHWIFFPPNARQSDLGVDGHPARGGFLPPVPLPRRMWAGGRLRFLCDLPIGEAARRETVVHDVVVKKGRQGVLVFLTLIHRIGGLRGLAIEEHQDIVYRSQSSNPPSPAPYDGPDADWREELWPSPVLLFRYSALTFNAHRIHYDLPYARDEEGYSGLVVQGPLTATLLADRAARWAGQRPTGFSFRGVSPLIADEPMALCGRRDGEVIKLWAEGPDGRLAMTAVADFGRTV